MRENAPANGATSSFAEGSGRRAESPVFDDPSAELERELAGTHLGKRAERGEAQGWYVSVSR